MVTLMEVVEVIKGGIDGLKSMVDLIMGWWQRW